MEIGKAELKKILKEQREEFQTFIGALVEDFTVQVKLLAESVSDLQRQLIAIRDMVAQNTKDIEMMKMDILVIKEDIESIKYTSKKKVDVDEFAVLEKRVLILERNR
ncbi:MAG: hypothetical protein Q7S34_02905, partial [bacterium]|nr:hypothetical protein [bacterium]